MAQYIFTINGKDYKVDVKSIEGTLAVIEVNGKTVKVNIKDLGKREMVKKPKFDNSLCCVDEIVPVSNKPIVIKSSLPGVILKVMVREGEQVKSGQDVIVMEAMKMENQIQATVSGTVKKIYVKEGDTIQQDTPLIEIEA
ncbi:MAG TPA: biotin/lipoyl-binding protein [Firmicutes bacterium]|uniref:Acetyl-CoA carboxylase biotin carboxyl carrier protein subunit n=1 Tax=candidate division TA06 bacterium TaxID=2250710 RepID=A0A660S4U6_UNCT6|nr:MAG: acetyl-CoA carboxylase biotin carboxyl carrier protein subunit [candidate division TA06 bacterium]HFD05165.1 biotin/lipoyl-binding protein [Bacillota bacterium]